MTFAIILIPMHFFLESTTTSGPLDLPLENRLTQFAVGISLGVNQGQGARHAWMILYAHHPFLQDIT